MSEQQKDQGKIEFWAIVEMMGHQRMAGFVREVSLGGDVLLRVDVPEVKYPYGGYGAPPEERTIAAFTRFVSPKALYALLAKPVELYSVTTSSTQRALPAGGIIHEDGHDADDFDIPDEDGGEDDEGF